MAKLKFRDGKGQFIEVSGGTGTSDYNDLSNKPKINNIELSGNKTLDNLGIQSKITTSNKLPYNVISGTPTIPTKTSDLTNDSGFLTQISSEYKTKSENDQLYQEKGNYITDSDLEEYDEAIQQELDKKQDELIAGDNITIEDNVISATGGGASIEIVRLV